MAESGTVADIASHNLVFAVEREIRLDPALEHALARIELTHLLAFGEHDADGRRGIEGQDSCAGRPNSYSERALRDNLERNLAFPVQFREHLGLARSWQ